MGHKPKQIENEASRLFKEAMTGDPANRQPFSRPWNVAWAGRATIFCRFFIAERLVRRRRPPPPDARNRPWCYRPAPKGAPTAVRRREELAPARDLLGQLPTERVGGLGIDGKPAGKATQRMAPVSAGASPLGSPGFGDMGAAGQDQAPVMFLEVVSPIAPAAPAPPAGPIGRSHRGCRPNRIHGESQARNHG